MPRFHITWGTGPGILAPFVERVRLAADRGLVTFKFRHRVRGLTKSGGAVDGVRGDILEPSSAKRGRKSSREVTGAFEFKAQAVIVSSGRIGANHDLVRSNWPRRLGVPPKRMICGVPDHVDGRMLAITEAAGFGGGGMHGYSALEGTFLGGCIFSGRAAGRAAAKSVE